MPAPGTMVEGSPAYVPMIFKGLSIHPDNPLLFDFIVDTGNSGLKPQTNDDLAIRQEANKLVKYFLASLTIDDNKQWVNLSPYEKGRILPEELGKTELGRDMLAQDYLLKQVTASLIHPAKELGHAFWSRVYERARQEFGTTDIPVDTFNKVWIAADKADVYVHNNTVYIVGAHLKVLLESDYLAAVKAQGPQASTVVDGLSQNSSSPEFSSQMELTKQIVREVIIPELEKEVNTGKNFANLRQMFHSMILATWYKKNLKESLLAQVYANKAKTGGVEGVWVAQKGAAIDPEKIWSQYEQAYKTGVFNFIKEDVDQQTGESIPHRYFSGGMADMAKANVVKDFAQKDVVTVGDAFQLTVAGQAIVADKAQKEPVSAEKMRAAMTQISEAIDSLRDQMASGKTIVALDTGVTADIYSKRGAKGMDVIVQFQRPWRALAQNGQVMLVGYRTAQKEENLRMWTGKNARTLRYFSVPAGAEFIVALADAAMITNRSVSLAGILREKLSSSEAASREVLQDVQARLQEVSRNGRYQAEAVQRQGHLLFQFTDKEQAGTGFTLMADKGFRLISMTVAGQELFKVNPDLETLGGGIFSMFPFVNRLKDGKLTRNGRSINVADLVAGLSLDGQTGNFIHGVARVSETWKDVSIGMEGDAVVIRASFETTDYPGLAEAFGHSKLTKTFRLEGNKLTTDVEVENLTTEAEAARDGGYEVYADVGEHPFMVYTPGKTKLLMPGTTRVFTVDDQKIPTGELKAVTGNQDFNNPQVLDHTLDHSFTVKADATGAVTAIMQDEGRNVVTSMKMEGMFAAQPGEEAVVHAWGGNETSYKGIGAIEPVPVAANGPNRRGEVGGSRPLVRPGEKRVGRITMTVDAAMNIEARPAGGRAARKTVLVVDDDVNLLESTSEIITMSNPDANIITAKNGSEAIAVLKAMSTEELAGLAAVYSDTQMPEADGFGVAEYVAGNLPSEVKYIAKSGNMSKEFVERYGAIFSGQEGRNVEILSMPQDIRKLIGMKLVSDPAMTNEKDAQLFPRRTVLMVDNHAASLSTVKDIIEEVNPGVEIITASSGLEAIAILQKMSPAELAGLAAVYSDTQMPDGDGFGVAEYVAQNLPVEIKYIAKSDDMTPDKATRYQAIFAGQAGRDVQIVDLLEDGIDRLESMRLIATDMAMQEGVGNEASKISRKTVLVVDDDASLLDITQQMIELRNPNAEIIVARNGAEALAKLRSMSPAELNGLAAVYSDTQMPEADGFAVAEYVSRNLPVEVKYVAKSGNMSEEFVARYQDIFAGQAGRTLEIISLPLDMRKLTSLELVAPDAAMKAPGGIDLNANNMTMGEKGEQIRFNFNPAVVEQFKQGNFTGISPIILNITPIQSIMPILGREAGEGGRASV